MARNGKTAEWGKLQVKSKAWGLQEEVEEVEEDPSSPLSELLDPEELALEDGSDPASSEGGSAATSTSALPRALNEPLPPRPLPVFARFASPLAFGFGFGTLRFLAGLAAGRCSSSVGLRTDFEMDVAGEDRNIQDAQVVAAASAARRGKFKLPDSFVWGCVSFKHHKRGGGVQVDCVLFGARMFE